MDRQADAENVICALLATSYERNQTAAEDALTNPYSSVLDNYIVLERLSLELSQLALDCLAIQKGVVPQQRQPKLATREQLGEVKEILLKLK